VILDGERPARVADVVLDGLRSREDASGFIALPSEPVRPEFCEGDEVMVTRGPLQALGGLYQGQSNGSRVLVLMAMLGGERVVNLARADIRAASGGEM
jgi:hypothetical protein